MEDIQRYRQEFIELAMACKQNMDPFTYHEFAEKQIYKLEDLFNELENLPSEVNFKDVNDIHLLRAYIRELLGRIEFLNKMIDNAIDEFEEITMCPLDDKEYPADLCHDRKCSDCWKRYLRTKGSFQKY